MGGFGAISGMISSIRENKKLLATKKSLRDQKESYFGTHHSKPLKFTDSMSQLDHEKFRKTLEKKAKRSNYVLLVLIIVILIFTIWSIHFILSIPAH